MTELSGNKRRVHTRHEAHGSVSVPAVVLPAGANLQGGQRGLEMFVGHTGLLDELEVLGRWEYERRLRQLAAALLCTLLGHTLGLLECVQGSTVQHDLSAVAGFGALLDLVVRDDPTNVYHSVFRIDLFPAQRRHFTRPHAGIKGELKVRRVDPH
ncbi:hypothetical protein D3C71_1757520 [compost metagenome]